MFTSKPSCHPRAINRSQLVAFVRLSRPVSTGRLAKALGSQPLNLGLPTLARRMEPSSGRLTHLETVSTVPNDFADISHCAEITMHPSGRWLFVTNRALPETGCCSVAIFGVVSGKLHAHRIAHRIACFCSQVCRLLSTSWCYIRVTPEGLA